MMKTSNQGMGLSFAVFKLVPHLRILETLERGRVGFQECWIWIPIEVSHHITID